MAVAAAVPPLSASVPGVLSSSILIVGRPPRMRTGEKHERETRSGHRALTNKKAGKTVVTGTVEFAADSKTRTLTTHGTDAAGKKLTGITVYERQ